MTGPASAAAAGTIEIGGDLVVRRMGYGAMRVTREPARRGHHPRRLTLRAGDPAGQRL